MTTFRNCSPDPSTIAYIGGFLRRYLGTATQTIFAVLSRASKFNKGVN